VIVLDTNVTSELMRPSPSSMVTAWVRSRTPTELFTTSITLAEILYGIERLPGGRRREVLRSTATEVFTTFADHVLPFDASAAVEYARIVGDRDRAGAPIDGFDAQIAAISRVHGAALATRNIKDFRDLGLQLIDPWRSQP
jgi:predicted nucleic acid-binding protein